MEIQESVLPTPHPDTAETLLGLAKIYLQSALAILGDGLPPAHPVVRDGLRLGRLCAEPVG